MEILKGVNRLEIKCNIKFYFIQGFGFSLSTIITGILFIQSLLNLNKSISKTMFFEIIGLFILSFFLSMWYVFGYEKIIIDKNKNCLSIIRSNQLFTYSKKYPLNKIKRSESYQYKDSFLNRYRDYVKEMQRAILWSEMGRIYFFNGVSKITILNGLEEENCQKVLLLIRAYIDKSDLSEASVSVSLVSTNKKKKDV